MQIIKFDAVSLMLNPFVLMFYMAYPIDYHDER